MEPRANFIQEEDTTTVGSNIGHYITDRAFFSMFCDARTTTPSLSRSHVVATVSVPELTLNEPPQARHRRVPTAPLHRNHFRLTCKVFTAPCACQVRPTKSGLAVLAHKLMRPVTGGLKMAACLGLSRQRTVATALIGRVRARNARGLARKLIYWHPAGGSGLWLVCQLR
jgi:hypothetical protein